MILRFHNYLHLIFQLTNMYEEYLESFIFDTAKMIATKLFGRKESVAHIKPDEPTIEDTTKEEDNENKEIEQTPALTEEGKPFI